MTEEGIDKGLFPKEVLEKVREEVKYFLKNVPEDELISKKQVSEMLFQFGLSYILKSHKVHLSLIKDEIDKEIEKKY